MCKHKQYELSRRDPLLCLPARASVIAVVCSSVGNWTRSSFKSTSMPARAAWGISCHMYRTPSFLKGSCALVGSACRMRWTFNKWQP